MTLRNNCREPGSQLLQKGRLANIGGDDLGLYILRHMSSGPKPIQTVRYINIQH